jgi:hypothetical protein
MDRHDGSGTQARFKAYAAGLASALGPDQTVRGYCRLQGTRVPTCPVTKMLEGVCRRVAAARYISAARVLQD